MRNDSIRVIVLERACLPTLCAFLSSCQTTRKPLDDRPPFYSEDNIAEYYGRCPKCNAWIKGYTIFSTSWLIAKDGDEEFEIPYGGDSGVCGTCPTCKVEWKAIDPYVESRIVKWKPVFDKEAADAIIKEAIEKRHKLIIVVKSGDTISQIAKDHRVSVSDLVELNKLKDPNVILIGQKLRLPEKVLETRVQQCDTPNHRSTSAPVVGGR